MRKLIFLALLLAIGSVGAAEYGQSLKLGKKECPFSPAFTRNSPLMKSSVKDNNPLEKAEKKARSI